MADYYPLISRAVGALEKNSGENRRAIYDRARAALLAQLRGVTPALDESDITRERLALEESIRKVEAESARQFVEASRRMSAAKLRQSRQWERSHPKRVRPSRISPSRADWTTSSRRRSALSVRRRSRRSAPPPPEDIARRPEPALPRGMLEPQQPESMFEPPSPPEPPPSPPEPETQRRAAGERRSLFDVFRGLPAAAFGASRAEKAERAGDEPAPAATSEIDRGRAHAQASRATASTAPSRACSRRERNARAIGTRISRSRC